MPFHSKRTLEHWIAEFIDARSGGEDIRVAVQDGEDGQDTGLVVVPLENAPNTVWIEPRATGDDLTWHVLIEPSTETLELTSFELNGLTHELQIAAEVCAFLQEKSLGHFEPAASPESSPEASPAG
ncbi:MAG: hypothetical protein FJW64_03305 [Actinobacteria bacterium]|nr:hypothetical protein [Actinomycetota bacterium]